MDKMDPVIKKKWTAALRSGKYRQGTGALFARDGNRHIARCCLGVLCNVIGLKAFNDVSDNYYELLGEREPVWEQELGLS